MSNHYVKGLCLVTAKLRRNSQITVPRAVRNHLGLRAGDVLSFAFEGDRVVMTKTSRQGEFEPFGAFAEWDGEDDRLAYAGL